MKSILCVVILMISPAHAASLPGDSANGARFYEANCMGCHDTSVSTRKDRVVQSLDALKKQLASCTHMANKEFSESETQDLLKYLNDQFYHFRYASYAGIQCSDMRWSLRQASALISMLTWRLP